MATLLSKPKHIKSLQKAQRKQKLRFIRDFAANAISSTLFMSELRLPVNRESRAFEINARGKRRTARCGRNRSAFEGSGKETERATCVQSIALELVDSPDCVLGDCERHTREENERFGSMFIHNGASYALSWLERSETRSRTHGAWPRCCEQSTSHTRARFADSAQGSARTHAERELLIFVFHCPRSIGHIGMLSYLVTVSCVASFEHRESAEK